jgi:ribose transport system substrate-binding protein
MKNYLYSTNLFKHVKNEFACLIVLAVMVVSLAPSVISTKEMSEKIRIGVVFKALDSEFWQTMKKGVDAESAKHPNLEIALLAPKAETDIAQQVEMIENLIIKRVDALLIAPSGSEEIIPTLEKAKKANIPVIILDTDTPWEGKVCFVGSNNAEGGKLAANFIVRKLNGKGKVAIITGVMGHATHMDRLKGAKAVFEAEEGIEIVAVQPANSDRYQGMQVMENILVANPDLDGVFCTNDQMALGALEALKSAKKEKKIVLIGFDAVPEALRQIKENSGLDATISQNPYLMGKRGVEVALRVLNGEKIPPEINTGVKTVTRENVDSFL